jgi:hypothetical protein
LPEVSRVSSIRKRLKLDLILDDLDGTISDSLEGANRVNGIVEDLKGFATFLLSYIVCIQTPSSLLRLLLPNSLSDKKTAGRCNLKIPYPPAPAGRRTVKVVPFPGSLSTVISPLWVLMMS